MLYSSITTNSCRQIHVKQPKIGLLAAMVMHFAIVRSCFSNGTAEPLFRIEGTWIHGHFSMQSLILIVVWYFLIYKSVSEIHHKLDADDPKESKSHKSNVSLTSAVLPLLWLTWYFLLIQYWPQLVWLQACMDRYGLWSWASLPPIVIMIAFTSGWKIRQWSSDSPNARSGLLVVDWIYVDRWKVRIFHICKREVGTVPKG